MKVSLIVDNNEMQDIYNFMKDVMRESILTEENADAVLHWQDSMSDDYRSRDVHCMVFDDDDVPLLRKVAQYHARNYRHIELSKKLTRFFDNIGDIFWDTKKPNDNYDVWVSSDNTWDTGIQQEERTSRYDDGDDVPF